MIPRKIIENSLDLDGIKYIPVKVLRNSLDKNELEKFSDWFFGKPVVVGVNKECGIPLTDIQQYFDAG
ncbi:MAG: hypothetical protein KKF08_19065 [Gammaproteobacteria bacterium]|nr:hypothetical protein [Gammaproteobacteria bacterium]